MIDEELFSIQVTPETLMRRASGSIIGHIWITMGDWAFPGLAWDDFPVVILGWWIESWLSRSSEGQRAVRCNFMDGPYWFEITTSEPQRAIVKCFQDSKAGSKLLHKTRCKRSSITGALLAASESILQVCKEHEWTSSDLDNLFRLHSNLRSTSFSK
ncbi:MAG TPA: hypothetical protein VLB46_05525 [Pyrinomonadaceae bacterium]|nr:hypothetical protein [Pyrinomonadaceae bacterium]